MKEKSTMEDKIFDFAKTRDALGQLSTDLIELETAVKIKASQIENYKKQNDADSAEKEHKITELQKTVKDALEQIESINNYISEVL